MHLSAFTQHLNHFSDMIRLQYKDSNCLATVSSIFWLLIIKRRLIENKSEIGQWPTVMLYSTVLKYSTVI